MSSLWQSRRRSLGAARGNAPAAERPQKLETTDQPLGLYPSFLYGLGGTTNLWHGGLLEMSPEEMGPAWPKGVRDDLARYYPDLVCRLYGNQAAEAWAQRVEMPLGETGSLTSIFYPAEPYSAAAGTQFNNCDLRLHARVIGIEESDRGVVVASQTGGQVSKERFDSVVLACGGINSPIVLRRSGLGGAAAGQNITDHPMGFVAKFAAPNIRNVLVRLQATTGSYANSEPLVKLRDAETGLWSAFYLRPAAIRNIRSDPYARAFGFLGYTNTLKKYAVALPQLADLDFFYQVLENRAGISMPSRYCYVLVINEQEPRGQGSVVETPEGGLRLRWTISDAVQNAVARNLKMLAGLLGAEMIPTPGRMSERLWSAAHHSGACRISAKPSLGVVDSNLKVHGTKQIYVCDGSVLPSTGCTNTGLTIGALSYRLAEHLRKKFDMAPGVRKSGSSKPARNVLVSGAGGRIGQMVRLSLADSDVRWQAVSLREGVENTQGPPTARLLLHLANAHHDVEENKRLQVRAADLIADAGVTEVAVSLSFVTLGALAADGPDASALNFGFRNTSPFSYPRGKLAAEEFWLDWQRGHANRKVLFLYIPTICGPHAEWTLDQARHAPGKTLLLPRIEHFFVVSEEDLTANFMDILKRGLTSDIDRQILLSSATSLGDAVDADRSEASIETRLPRLLWRLCGTARRRPLLDKGMSAIRKVADIILRKTAGRAIIPISANYLHLFNAQSALAGKISKAAQLRFHGKGR